MAIRTEKFIAWWEDERNSTRISLSSAQVRQGEDGNKKRAWGRS